MEYLLENNMKPFDLELAKAGHPVQTRDGRPVRIICYDRKDNAHHLDYRGLIEKGLALEAEAGMYKFE